MPYLGGFVSAWSYVVTSPTAIAAPRGALAEDPRRSRPDTSPCRDEVSR